MAVRRRLRRPRRVRLSSTCSAQYVKDFSFENPNAPRSLAPTQAQPAINIQINVGAQQLAETDYEVSLNLEGKAESSGSVLFVFELTFAGVFRVQNVPPQSLQPMVMIECPRLLFPFAREIVATAVRNGGFPPLLLDPVDFVSLYQQRVAQMQASPASDVDKLIGAGRPLPSLRHIRRRVMVGRVRVQIVPPNRILAEGRRQTRDALPAPARSVAAQAQAAAPGRLRRQSLRLPQ